MASDENPSLLAGRRILVAEDEFLIAIHLRETFQTAGAEVVVAPTLQAAHSIARDQILSAAVLDFRLGSQTTEAVADILLERNVPFVFHTGQPLPDGLRRRFHDVAVLIKPVRQGEFVDAVLRIMAR